MWRLTVERKFKNEFSAYEDTDRVYFDAEKLEELAAVVELFNNCAVEGKYTFKIQYIEKEAEDEAGI